MSSSNVRSSTAQPLATHARINHSVGNDHRVIAVPIRALVKATESWHVRQRHRYWGHCTPKNRLRNYLHGLKYKHATICPTVMQPNYKAKAKTHGNVMFTFKTSTIVYHPVLRSQAAPSGHRLAPTPL